MTAREMYEWLMDCQTEILLSPQEYGCSPSQKIHSNQTSPPGVAYLRGQKERGESTGYIHWQLVAYLEKPARLSWIKRIFGESTHAEPTRSEAADAYVWKEETSIDGTRFELGTKKFNRKSETDWELVRKLAKSGDLEQIPPDIYVRCYSSLKKIASDSMQPVGVVREVWAYVGKTGAGKSRRAWEEAGLEAYPKDPNTKYWDGYRGHSNVVIDEFRGRIDISHILRWLDRYPVIVEVKGSSIVLKAEKIWITSNIHPKEWYKEIDNETVNALLRRIKIVEFYLY